MKIELDITDEQLDAAVRARHAALPSEEQLAIAAVAPKPGERIIVIGPDDRRALEAVFQTTVDTPADLVKKVRKLSSFSIGGVERTFAPDELARIDMQAQFHGRTRSVFIAEMVEEIVGRMLEQV